MISTTATKFRANIKNYLDAVLDSNDEVIISRGNDAAVLMSLADYNAIKETEYLLSSPEMERIIRQGMEDAATGNYKVLNPDEL